VPPAPVELSAGRDHAHRQKTFVAAPFVCTRDRTLADRAHVEY
jgi:hypothetical protein